MPLQCWVSATTAEEELTRRYQGGCEVAGSWVTLDTEAGTTAGGGVGAWLLYRGGENALYTPALAPPSSSCPSLCSRRDVRPDQPAAGGGSKSPYLVEGAVPGEMLDIPAWGRLQRL